MPKVYLTEDYLIRIINQVLAVLAAIVGLKTAGQYLEAQQLVDQGFETLFGLRSDLLKLLDDDRLKDMLTNQGRLDLQRLTLAADLFKEQGDIQMAGGNREAMRGDYQRALNFYLEAALGGQADQEPDLPVKIDHLIKALSDAPFPADIQYSLFNYYENTGRYLEAENALSQLSTMVGETADIQDEFRDFYRRLLEKTGEELKAGGLERADIQRKLSG